jgi:hypothetical protein
MRLVDSYDKNLISTLLPKGVIRFMNDLGRIVIDIDIQTKRMPLETSHLRVFISKIVLLASAGGYR